MQFSIDILQKERDKIVCDLKSGQKERLIDLQDIDKALGCLRLLTDRQADKASCYNLEKLPFPINYPWSNYRLMVDMEEDNIEDWTEYEKADGTHHLLYGDDILLIAKPR